MISLVKRNRGLSLEQFLQYWAEEHAQLVLRSPHIIRYVQCHAISLPSGEQPYDGAAEMWWHDLDSYNAWINSFQSQNAQVLKARQEEMEKFLDTSKTVSIITEEKIFK